MINTSRHYGYICKLKLFEYIVIEAFSCEAAFFIKNKKKTLYIIYIHYISILLLSGERCGW